MTNQYLDELAAAHGGAGPTAQELDALNRIAGLRAQGLTNAQIYGTGAGGEAGGDMTVGNYGYLPYVLQAAGINSSYDLGRGNLAANLQDSYYNRQSNPFQIVGALQQQRDTGAGVGDSVIRNITPSQAPYQGYLDQLFSRGPSAAASVEGSPAGSPAAGASPGGLDAQTQAVIRDAYARDPQGAENFFAAQSGRAPRNMALISGASGGSTGMVRQTNPLSPLPAVPRVAVPGGETVTPVQQQIGIPGGTTVAPIASGAGSAQGAAAQLIGGAIHVGMAQPQFQNTLRGGQVPGFGTFNEADFGKLTPDQRAAYFGTVASTGAVSDPAAAYADYVRKYSQGGLGGGVSYR